MAFVRVRGSEQFDSQCNRPQRKWSRWRFLQFRNDILVYTHRWFRNFLDKDCFTEVCWNCITITVLYIHSFPYQYSSTFQLFITLCLRILWQSPYWGSQCFHIPLSPLHTLSRLTVDSRVVSMTHIYILFTRLTEKFSHSWPDPISVPVWMHLRVNVFTVLKALCSGVT